MTQRHPLSGGHEFQRDEVNEMINGFEDVQKAGRDGINRAMQSFSALSQGWQTLATETAGFSKQSLEDSAAHFEKLLGVKSFDVAVTAQTDFVKASYERAVGQAARFGELYLDLVKEAVKPFEGFVPVAGK
jgi:phasin family protein